MLSGSIAVLSRNKGYELCIGKRNYSSVSKGAIERHFQGIGHVLCDLTIGQVHIRILSRHVHAERILHHCIVEGVDRTFQILDDFRCGFQRFLTIGLIISGAACAGNGPVGIGGNTNGYRLILRNGNGRFGLLDLVRQIIGSLFSGVGIAGNAIHHTVYLYCGNHSHSYAFVCRVGYGNDTFHFLFHISDWEHFICVSVELGNHIAGTGILLLKGCRVCG